MLEENEQNKLRRRLMSELLAEARLSTDKTYVANFISNVANFISKIINAIRAALTSDEVEVRITFDSRTELEQGSRVVAKVLGATELVKEVDWERTCKLAEEDPTRDIIELRNGSALLFRMNEHY